MRECLPNSPAFPSTLLSHGKGVGHVEVSMVSEGQPSFAAKAILQNNTRAGHGDF